jgi:hypothetical protein
MSVPYPDDPTRSYDRPEYVNRSGSGDKIKPENPKHHPLAYLALLLSVIALILAGKALHDADSHGNNDLVHVGGKNCIVVHHDNAPAGLFCQTD